VHGLELRIILDLAFEVHLPKHIQSRLLSGAICAGPSLGFQGAYKMPTAWAPLEPERLAIVASSDYFVFSAPNQAHERKELSGDAYDSTGRLIRTAGVYDGDAAIMSSKGQDISAGRERDGVDPASGVVQELSAHGVERKSLTPHTGGGTAIDTFDEGGEYPSVGVGRPSSKEDGVRMPGDSSNSTSNRLLQMLRNPPVILLLKVTNGNDAVARSYSKLGLGRRPSSKCRSSGNSQKHKGWLVSGRRRFPYQSITI